jgi:hypothetical protein
MITPAERKFLEFHHANPHVYNTFVRLARSARRRGKNRLSIGMLFEVLRWEIALTTTDPDFKINNNYRPRYARLLMKREPDLAGFFVLREMQP